MFIPAVRLIVNLIEVVAMCEVCVREFAGEA